MKLPIWGVVASGTNGILKVVKVVNDHAITATPIFGSLAEAEEFLNRRDYLKGFIPDEIPSVAEFNVFWKCLAKGDVNYVAVIESGRFRYVRANHARNRIRWSRPL